MQVWLCNLKTTIIKKEQSAEDRYSSEPENAHPTGEFVIVAKFGGHVLHHLASRLANVIRERGMGGRERRMGGMGGREGMGGKERGTLKPGFSIFFNSILKFL